MGGPGSGQDRPEALAALELAREVSPPGTAAMTHGLRSRAFYPCRKCLWQDECDEYDREATCAIERLIYAARVAEIMAQPQVVAIDRPRVVRAVMDEIRAATGEAYLRRQGEFKVDNGELRYAAAAAEVRLLKANADRALDALGIGPVARRGFGADKGAVEEYAATMDEVEAEETAQRADAAATDAEFSEGDDQEGDVQ